MLSKEEIETQYLYKDKNGIRYIQGKAIRDNTIFKGWEIIPLWEKLNCFMKKEKKANRLETDKQKLIEKLEKDRERFNQTKKVFMTQSSQINASLISYIEEILKILKGEKE